MTLYGYGDKVSTKQSCFKYELGHVSWHVIVRPAITSKFVYYPSIFWIEYRNTCLADNTMSWLYLKLEWRNHFKQTSNYSTNVTLKFESSWSVTSSKHQIDSWNSIFFVKFYFYITVLLSWFSFIDNLTSHFRTSKLLKRPLKMNDFLNRSNDLWLLTNQLRIKSHDLKFIKYIVYRY